MFFRFSIMLILYLRLYLSSSDFILAHGYFPHLKQNFQLFSLNTWQFLIMQRLQLTALFSSLSLQPGHVFLSLRYALQIPQFIPHGAISLLAIFNSFVILIDLFNPDLPIIIPQLKHKM